MLKYSKAELNRQAKELGFVRDTFEKVCRLADVLTFMESDPLLADSLSESRRFEEKVEQTARDFGQSSKAVSRNRAAVLAVYGLIIDVSFWIMLTAGLARDRQQCAGACH